MWHLVVWDFDSIYCKKMKILITNFSLQIAKKCRNVHVCISTQPHRQQLETHTHAHTHTMYIQKVKSKHLYIKKETSLGFCFNKCLMLKK
jgi:hypothetical protein